MSQYGNYISKLEPMYNDADIAKTLSEMKLIKEFIEDGGIQNISRSDLDKMNDLLKICNYLSDNSPALNKEIQKQRMALSKHGF